MPSTSTAAGAGRRSPYSKDRALTKGGSSRNGNRNNGPPLPFPAINDGSTEQTGSTALKHSTTIVGRHGEKGAGTGAAAGIRVKGRKTNWRPKPHQLGQQHIPETGSATNTPRPDDTDRTFQDDLQDGAPGDSHFLFQDVTPQPSRRPSRDDALLHHEGESESDEYDHQEEDESTDEEVDNASSDTDDGIIGQNAGLPPPIPTAPSGRRYDAAAVPGSTDSKGSRRPYSERALSEAIAKSNLPHSPTGSYGETASASTSVPASQAEGSMMGDTTSASLTGSSAAQMSNLSVPGARRRKDTLEGADTPSMNTSPSVDDRLAGVDSDEEEDDFEFSLPGNDGSSPTTFLSSQSGSGITTPIGGVTTFVSPPNASGILPSIAEAAEMNEQLSGNSLELGEPSQTSAEALEAGQLSEEAALKAAQSARRRARRRVNISGRMPLKLNIPPSPELPPEAALSPTSPRTRPSSAGAGSSRPHSPVTALAGLKGVNLPADGKPGSPGFSYSSSPLVRSKSGKIIRRQRAQTDPVSLSASKTPLPSPGLPRTRSSDSQRPLHTATPPPGTATPGTQTPNSNRTKSLNASPVARPREIPTPELLPTPTKGHLPRRAKSTGPGETASPLKLHHDATEVPILAKSASAAANVDVAPDLARPSPRKAHSRNHHNHDPYVTFPIQKIEVQHTPPPAHSALSVMLRKEDSSANSASNNPFNELYGALFAPEKPPAPRRRFGPARDDDNGAFVVTMYYPFSKDPSKPIKLTLKPDLIVEEVIGCALWKYWEAERKPSLLPDASGNNDEKWDEKGEEAQSKLKASQYILRIADEDEDGEVDDDFPAPERTRPAKGFGTCYAVVPATPAQAKQYQQTDSQIQRRPSRIIRRVPRPTVTPQTSATNLAAPNGTLMPPTATSHILPTGGGGMSSAASYISASFAGTPTKASFNLAGSAPLVLVRIRIPLRGLEDVTTAVKVPLDMYLADVLETLCKKRNLGNPRDWVLVVPDRGIIVPLDRTVESLQGAYHLALQKKSTMPHAANAVTGTRTKTGIVNTNPSGECMHALLADSQLTLVGCSIHFQAPV